MTMCFPHNIQVRYIYIYIKSCNNIKFNADRTSFLFFFRVYIGLNLELEQKINQEIKLYKNNKQKIYCKRQKQSNRQTEGKRDDRQIGRQTERERERETDYNKHKINIIK